MCGIAGVFHYGALDRPVDRALLARMTRRLAHRGPDDEGYFVDGPLGLGHRRLAIVDLTDTGRQPMTTPDGRWTIAYNGELYDHARHRPKLEGRGVRFRGTSDTETLLHLLASEPADFLAGVRGIFAFAAWDRAERRLVLARDHLGVKQLYVHDDGRRVLFASEIKALLEAEDVTRELDPEALNQYLHFHTPLFERTFFRGIRQLKPAEVVSYDARGRRAQTYWAIRTFEERHEAPEQVVEELRETLGRVVQDQLLSDVPVGSFFSGGIDSTAIAATAKRLGRPLHCYGVHFTGEDVIDERPFQEAAARTLKLPLSLITLDGSQFADDVQRLMYFQDQPVIGAAMIPMFHVSKLAAGDVKVALGGQAADEIFGGYARYALTHPARVLASIVRQRLKPVRRGSASAVAPAVGGNLGKQLFEARTLRRLFNNARLLVDWKRGYFDNFAGVSERRWKSFLAPELVSRARAYETYEATVSASPATDPYDKVMHWDVQTYLPGLFQQDDRMSMANSLESRVPLADPLLVEFAFRCGPRLKMRDGASKWVLRQAVADVTPEFVLNRRKVGFDTPAARWMKTSQRDFVHDMLLSSRARSRGWLDGRRVESLLRDTSDSQWFDLAWKLLALETWASVHVDGRPPEIAASPPPLHSMQSLTL